MLLQTENVRHNRFSWTELIGRPGRPSSRSGFSAIGRSITDQVQPFDIRAEVNHEPAIMLSFATFRRGLHRAGNLIAGN